MPLPFNGPDDAGDIKGTRLPVQQPDEYLFVRGQGWQTVKTWEGATKDGIFGKAEEMRLALFNNIRVTKANGVWRVSGTIEGQGEGEPPPEDGQNETWEVDSLSEGASIENHPLFQGIDDDELRAVKDAIQNPVEGEAPALTDANAQLLYTLLLRKVDTYSYEVPMLRHTMTPAPENVRVDGWQEVWTPAQINVTTPIIANMVLEFSANNPFGTIADYAWGWMNGVLRVTEDVHGRSQLTEEWLLGLWHSDLYPAY